MKNLFTSLFALALALLPNTILANAGGGEPGYSCRGHEGETQCVGKRENGWSGHYGYRECYNGLWRQHKCDDGCYLLPRPRCRPQPKCQTEPDHGGGCVSLEDYEEYEGESDATDAD